jgi:hypothetical protein
VGDHDDHDGRLRRPLPRYSRRTSDRRRSDGSRYRSVGLLAASLASFFVERDIEKELDPQMAEIDERLKRIEQLLQNLQPSEGMIPDHQAEESDQTH